MDKQIQELKQHVKGKVIAPADSQYEQLRSTLFNPDGHPAVIVQVDNNEDIAAGTMGRACLRITGAWLSTWLD